jgi:hypothetical protein
MQVEEPGLRIVPLADIALALGVPGRLRALAVGRVG